MENKMNENHLKKQAVFRMAIFFAITIIIGFVASDINMLSSQ
jgi:preprotein translocase subunit SecG